MSRAVDAGATEFLEAYRALKTKDPEAAELLVAVMRKLVRLRVVRK